MELLRDLEILIASGEEDYAKKQTQTYERYLDEYNRILTSLQRMGLFDSLALIQRVSDDEKAYMGMGYSLSEEAKHREIVNESKKLLHRVRTYLGGETIKIDALQTLEQIFSKFHSVARQLRDRFNNRNTLDIKDEYDVQDLLHAILKIFFDDIRPEETTPSYAASSKRMDFLLKSEKVVIEVKKTRDGLSAKEVGEQLMIDIATYSTHPDCKTLVCFVYDPEGRIGNPVGLEKDLANLSREELQVVVFIFPK